MLYLKPANFDDLEKQHTFVAAEPADENGFMNDYHDVSLEDFKSTALPRMIDFSVGKNLPEGFVPENELYLHCNIDNPASLKVMLKNGGVIHHKDQSGYYVRIKLRG